ncbi:MAG: hypothetical protein AAFZ65_04645 [Planctomycetota bacterium]
MNGIDAAGGIRQLASTFGQGGMRGAPPSGAARESMQARASSITNGEGQSLYDIRDELKSAVTDALKSSDGSDPAAAVQGAIQSTLESNGFDVAEVRSAMEAGGGPFGSPSGGSPFGAASSVGGGSAQQDLVEQFLAQLRTGANLDLKA